MQATSERRIALVGGRVLLPGEDEPVPASVEVTDGRISAVDRVEGAADRDGSAEVVDVTGRWVLPGIVDLHGDAFERCLMPRAGVTVDVDLALADNDLQLLSAGITTSYLSATDSWEPGLRSRQTLRTLVDALERRRGLPDVRLHVRHERCNTEAIEELVALVETGRVAMLSYNDHTKDEAERISMTQIQRTGLDGPALGALQVERAAARDAGLDHERRLADAARAAGCPTASHDACDEADLERDLALGVAIAEFPMSMDLAHRYRAQGVPVLLGAPNLVRGGSHLGNLSVAEALADGAGDLLCSDYHYPSLFHAPFRAATDGVLSLGRAWALVSANPAAAAGLTDRGRIEVGLRADLLVVDPPDGSGPGGGLATLERVLVGGRPATLRP
jgi:alpha-D-ribose 1-methylphosphonate 5-triphosphate diphosphatase